MAQLAEVQMELAENEDDWTEAAANFQAAAALLRAIGKVNAAHEAEIGLAELLRQRGDLEAALRQIAPILPRLPSVAADGWDEPIHVYVVCVQILRTNHDARAEGLLKQGLHLLTCLAQNISDSTLRQHFLQAIPAHSQLQALSTIF